MRTLHSALPLHPGTRRASLLAGLLTVAIFAVSLSPGQARAEPVELGGKFAASILVSVTSESANDTTLATFQLAGSRILSEGHHEFGAGVHIFGLFADNFDFGIYTLTAQYRYNLTPIGPEKNIVFYGGANLGVSIVDSSFTDTEASAAGGPRFGVDYYFTPRIAVQLDDSITISEKPTGSGAAVTNTLALGVRFLF